MSTNSAYSSLEQRQKRLYHLASIQSILHWDEQVMMPSGSASARAEQLSAISRVVHECATDPGWETVLAELEAESQALDTETRAVVREARREYDRLVKLPSEFVAAKTKLDSESHHAWVAARKKSDFSSFAPYLTRQLEMSLEEASLLGFSGKEAYAYHVDKHDPGIHPDFIDEVFQQLREELVPLVQTIVGSPRQPGTEFLQGFPIERQREFLSIVTKRIGFDYERGRLDVSVHPFCGGTASDIRMTTRFAEDLPLSSLFGAIHETGHALYEQGLRPDQTHNALGQHAGMAVHESQSRLWENQVGRSRPFWQFFEPLYREYFPAQLAGIDSDTLYFAVNSVTPGLIRVESDEVTYNLHILLRFFLEKELFAGTLKVADLPAAWNELSSELLGLTPRHDAEGVLQDIHWSMGAFGYFPSYCLGNMMAAQLWYALRKDLPNLDDEIAAGKFDSLLQWLRHHVHARGRVLDGRSLLREITGHDLGPQSLLRYLRERYLPLYT